MALTIGLRRFHIREAALRLAVGIPKLNAVSIGAVVLIILVGMAVWRWCPIEIMVILLEGSSLGAGSSIKENKFLDTGSDDGWVVWCIDKWVSA